MIVYTRTNKRGGNVAVADKNYSHQLDAKNRMRIPAKLREELGEGFYLTVGTGGCLYAYSKEEAEKVKATLKNINPYREKQLKAARFVLFNLREIFLTSSFPDKKYKPLRYIASV